MNHRSTINDNEKVIALNSNQLLNISVKLQCTVQLDKQHTKYIKLKSLK